MSVAGKIVLITGASRGLGRASAEAFLRAGAQVIATGRDRKAIAETEELLKSTGGSYRVVELEVTDEESVSDLFASLERLDVLVNNAGIARIGSLVETSTKEFREIFDVNVIGAFIVMREAMRKMSTCGGGDVINIASDAALHGIAGMGPYVASKHALLGLGRSARLEMKGQNIRVSTICPGGIKTEILAPLIATDGIDPDKLAQMIVDIAAIPRSIEVQEMLIQSI